MPSLPSKTEFIAWLASHANEEVGLAQYLNIAGPVANWLRSLGYSEVLVTREVIMGIIRSELVVFGAPTPEWQRVLAAEDSFLLEDTRGIITGRGLLERLEEFAP